MAADAPDELTHPALSPAMPGARAPTYRWIWWGLGVMALGWAVTLGGLAHVPTLPLLGGSVALLVLGAAVVRPRQDRPARRRLWWLLLLPIPWVLAVLLGPLGLVPVRPDPVRIQWMLQAQNIALGASVVLPLALLWPMRGARRSTALIGALNLLLCFLVTTASVVIIDPGS